MVTLSHTIKLRFYILSLIRCSVFYLLSSVIQLMEAIRLLSKNDTKSCKVSLSTLHRIIFRIHCRIFCRFCVEYIVGYSRILCKILC